MGEVWKPIKGYEGFYEVSNLGRVRSLPRKTEVRGLTRRDGSVNTEYWFRPGKIITPLQTGPTCACVRLYDANHNRTQYTVKRLVAEAFMPGFDPEKTTNSIRQKDKSKGFGVDNLYIV